jgi:hypothetical protein
MDVITVGGLAYLTDDTGLKIIDVSNPAAPFLVGAYDASGLCSGVSVVGSLAYIAAWSRGLLIVDVSNPATPVLQGVYDTPGFSDKVQVAGNIAYVADRVNLQLVDVSNPASPTSLGLYDTPGFAWDVSPQEKLAYVADYEGGLLILHVVTSTTPGIDLWIQSSSRISAPTASLVTIPIQYGNLGATIANPVTLTATMSNGLTYLGDTSGIPPTLNGNTVMWALPALSFGDNQSFSIIISLPDAPIGTKYSFNLTINSGGMEVYPDDNNLLIEVMVARLLFLPLIRR